MVLDIYDSIHSVYINTLTYYKVYLQRLPRYLFGASVRRSSGRRSGGRLLAMTQWPLFSSVFPFFSPVFFPQYFSCFFSSVATPSHRRSARIKKLIQQKLLRTPKNLGVHTFPDPLCHFGAPWRPFWILQAVRRCRRLASAPFAARLVFRKILPKSKPNHMQIT